MPCATTAAEAGAAALHALLDYVKPFISWKAFAILLAIVNIKNAPFAWHARVFYYMISRTNFTKHNLATKTKSRITSGDGDGDGDGGISSHPIFAPSCMLSHTPLTEMDYNFHKSNSTYFSDLDVSRTVLVTDIYTPGIELIRRELDQQRVVVVGDDDVKGGSGAKKGKKMYPGGIFVVLGSVYCSFKKPIIAYERYEMQSRIVGWDEKWLYVVTYFLRPAGKGKGKGKGKKELLAVGISEYVTKKGRYTIPPARVLAASGLLPEKPPSAVGMDTTAAGANGLNGSSSNGNGAAAADTPPAGGDKIDLPDAKGVKQEVLEEQKAKNAEAVGMNPEWTWENIEKERMRGMGLVKQFVGLEMGLLNEVRL